METAVLAGSMTELLTQLALLVITIVTGLIAKPLFQTLRTRLSAQQFQFLQDVASAAVLSAEQNKLNGAISDKKNYAIEILVEQLDKAGINVSPDAIDDAIEAAVHEAFNYGQTVQLDEPADGATPA